MSKNGSVAVHLLLAGWATACGREDMQGEVTGNNALETRKGETLALTQGEIPAAEQIAAARCDREGRCGNIGEKGDYSSRENCMTQIRIRWRVELQPMKCEGGVVQEELSECLEEVRNEDCSAPFDTLGRIMACNPESICDNLK